MSPKEVRELLKAGTIIDYQGRNSMMPLTEATGHRRCDVVQSPLATRASVTHRIKGGHTIADLVIGDRDCPVLELLVSDKGLNAQCRQALFEQRRRELDKKLLDASHAGDLAAVKQTVRSGSLVDACDPWGRTALMEATGSGHHDVVQYLHEMGADVNHRDSGGWTPLMMAACNDQQRIAKFLVDACARVGDQESVREMSALAIASLKGYPTMVRLLLNAKADPLVRDYAGHACLQIAADPKVQKLLFDAEGKKLA